MNQIRFKNGSVILLAENGMDAKFVGAHGFTSYPYTDDNMLQKFWIDSDGKYWRVR